MAGAGPPLLVAQQVLESPHAALERARAAGLEGLIAKRVASRYRGGRSADWLKLKVLQRQEFAIVGFTPISHGGREIGALLVAVVEDGRFRYVGKVGTGFTTAQRRSLWDALDERRVESPPLVSPPRLHDARWSRPSLVAEIAFSEWTRDGLLRQPRFVGLRDDKRAGECARERAIPPEEAAHAPP